LRKSIVGKFVLWVINCTIEVVFEGIFPPSINQTKIAVSLQSAIKRFRNDILYTVLFYLLAWL